MRHIRNLLYLVIGLLLGFFFTVSHAETIAATSSSGLPAQVYYSVAGYSGYDQNAACVGIVTAFSGSRYYGVYSGGITAPRTVTCKGYDSTSNPNAPLITIRTFVAGWKCAVGQTPQTYVDQDANPNNCNGYVCPTGQNWTLSGSSCTRPDCVAPQARDSATGVCKDPCASKKDQYSTGYSPAPIGAPPPTGTFCVAGCVVTRTLLLDLSASGSEMLVSKTQDFWPTGQTYTGASCPVGTPSAVDSPAPPGVPPKKPVCSPGEGVMTSSSGAVKCVPAGEPDAVKPNVNIQKKAEAFQDGSTKTTTTTTTTDTNTGAKDINVVITSSGGLAGPAGTATSSTSSGTSVGNTGSANGSSEDDGTCDPKKDMCKNPGTKGIYSKKEKTFDSVLSKFMSDMKSTPFYQAVDTSLNITVPSSGACPNLSVSVPFLNSTVDLAPYICSSTAIEYFEMMGTMLKIVVGYIALTWIIL